MKCQIIQDLKSGKTLLEDVPAPQVRRGSLLVKTSRTLVSLGDGKNVGRIWPELI
jgi:hypothetical protein